MTYLYDKLLTGFFIAKKRTQSSSIKIVSTQILINKGDFYKSIKLQKHKIYEAELLQPACPFCGSLDLLHNGHLITNIHYPIAIASLPVIIRLAKQRVKCRTCERWSMAQSELVNKHCSISNASKLKVVSALTEDRSMTSIARENNISINTVQRVLGNCSHRFIDSYEYLPAHLAFDELPPAALYLPGW